MTTLTIQIPDQERDFFEKLAKKLNAKIIKVVEEDKHPNRTTKRAIADARAGKTKRIEDLDVFFKGI